jgi:2-isopropylmalate synthase
MNYKEKIAVALQLEKLGVDIIEAGFPASSTREAKAVKNIAAIVKNSAVAGLCRCLEKDIDAGWRALQIAVAPRIHIFLATSPIHLKYKLNMTREQAVEMVVDAVKYAKRYCADVEFSAEDASRSDPDFVCKVFGAAIDAGATTVNAPDTVGYAMPNEFGRFIAYIKEHTLGMEKAVLSTHVHNDLGLAVANSLAAIAAGADQIECTVNGIGERAGNAALEEIVMALRVRKEYWNVDTGVDSAQLYNASCAVAQATGVKVQPHKAIVGRNAFAHESGIHQHAVLANRATYEIMTPESVGFTQNTITLGKHSGKHAIDDRLRQLGVAVDGETLEEVFAAFKLAAKPMSDDELLALVRDASTSTQKIWELCYWSVSSGSSLGATCTIQLKNKKSGELHKKAALGNGPVDAAFNVIDQIIDREVTLEAFEIGAITGGEDALGETHVKITLDGGNEWNGYGISADIVESAINAYLAAINSMELDMERQAAPV